MHLVERVASGIPRMQEAMREANLPEPEFHTEGMFTVVFKRQISNSANYDTVNGIVNGIVNENEQAIINLLRTKPGLNASEIAENIIAARYIILYSVENAVKFYTRLGFCDFIEFYEPNQYRYIDGCKPMYIEIP